MTLRYVAHSPGRSFTKAGSAASRPFTSQAVELVVIELRVPALLAYRELVTRAVATACKLALPGRPSEANESQDESGREYTDQFVSAVGEAFNNVAIHGFVDRSVGEVTINIRTESDRVEIEVRDGGASFDPDGVPDPDLGGLPESGMGLFIIRSFVDDVTYCPGEINSLLMVKYFEPRGLTVEAS